MCIDSKKKLFAQRGHGFPNGFIGEKPEKGNRVMPRKHSQTMTEEEKKRKEKIERGINLSKKVSF
jgi:hypothetical protein